MEARERSGFVVIFRRSDGFAATSEQHTLQKMHSEGSAIPDFPLSVLSKTMRRVLSEQGDFERHINRVRRNKRKELTAQKREI